MADVLAGRRIVVPEARELDLLARMLEQQGAITIRCPMVAITDVPDAAPVVAWLCRFTTNPPDDLILMTGEGLERLVGFARRAGLGEAFLAALAGVRKITRGPKPVRRLRALGLTPDLAAEPPTSAGIILSLSRENLRGRKVAIQLYPEPESESARFWHNLCALGLDTRGHHCVLASSGHRNRFVCLLRVSPAAMGLQARRRLPRLLSRGDGQSDGENIFRLP
jgi:Uroporphyrinogen-III synthase HemD